MKYSPLHSFLVLYFTLVRPKVYYASVAWNSVTLMHLSLTASSGILYFVLVVVAFFSHLDYNYSKF